MGPLKPEIIHQYPEPDFFLAIMLAADDAFGNSRKFEKRFAKMHREGNLDAMG